MASLMPLALTVSCFGKIRIAFIFLIPAHPGSPGKKRVCVSVILIDSSTGKEQCHVHAGEEGHARPGLTTSRRKQDPVEKSVRMSEDIGKWRKYVRGVANLGIEDG